MSVNLIFKLIIFAYSLMYTSNKRKKRTQRSRKQLIKKLRKPLKGTLPTRRILVSQKTSRTPQTLVVATDLTT